MIVVVILVDYKVRCLFLLGWVFIECGDVKLFYFIMCLLGFM